MEEKVWRKVEERRFHKAAKDQRGAAKEVYGCLWVLRGQWEGKVRVGAGLGGK